MKKIFKRKTKLPSFLIVVFTIIIFIYSFIFVMNNTSIKRIIIDEENYKYNYNLRRNELNNTSYVMNTLSDIVDKKIVYNNIEYFSDAEVNTIEPLVYIYNTHQTESYSLNFVSDYSIIPTVMESSFMLREHLKDLGIESVVETRSMKNYLDDNNLSYKYSYESSRQYILDVKNKYPSIKYFIDLHRDSSKINKTLYERDNKRYARIMLVIGTKHDKYKDNEEFIVYLNNLLNNEYSGISRGIYERDDARFNQDISPYSILFEVGGVDNTIDEVYLSTKVIAYILSKHNSEVLSGN